MRVPLFVFLGLPNDRAIDHLSLLHDKLNSSLNKIVPNLKIFRKNDLLSIRHENASIYASILNDQKDFNDWIKMANDFELTVDQNKLDESLLEERLNLIKNKFPQLYKEIHYTLAKETYSTMREFSDLAVYAFL
jgi:hypothetical protein